MRIALVTDDTALRDLEPAWTALWSRTLSATPFQSPAWMLSWWACFGTGRPVVAVAHGSAAERPLIPTLSSAERGRGNGVGGLLACYLLDNKLLPMGVGLTDYQDALLAPEAPPRTAAELLKAVLVEARRRGAESFDLTDLPQGAALRYAALPTGWRDRLMETDCCPVLSVPPQASDLRGVVPKGRARDLRQAMHRIERAGGFAVEVAGTGALDALERLHTSRWRSLGESGVLADPRVLAFHRLAAPALHGSGALRLAVLRIGGEVAACCYALLASGRLFLYLSGFDPRFAFESPGTILLGRMIANAIAEGRREIHFLRGEERYKFAWGGSARLNATRSLYPP